MRRRWFVFVALTLALSQMLAVPKSAWACSCAFPPTPADAFARTEAAFQGTAVGVSNSLPLPFVDQIRDWLGLPHVDNYGGRLFSIEVTRSWKGVTTTLADIRTGYGGADCGYEFVIGVEYVVYAGHTSDGDWGTNICTRTTPTTSAVDDLTYLGPLPTLPLTPVPAPFNWLWLCLGLFVILIASALIGVWLWRSRRRRTHLTNL